MIPFWKWMGMERGRKAHRRPVRLSKSAYLVDNVCCSRLSDVEAGGQWKNGIKDSVEPSPHLFYLAKVMWANPGAGATWALRGIGK